MENKRVALTHNIDKFLDSEEFKKAVESIKCLNEFLEKYKGGINIIDVGNHPRLLFSADIDWVESIPLPNA